MKLGVKPTPKTHKEILQERFDAAELAYREEADNFTRIDGQMKAEDKALEQLEGEYTTACRALASGGSVDVNIILGEKERRINRRHGLATLLRESTDRLNPLGAAQAEAARALQAEVERLEIERLEAVIASAESETKKAHSAVNAAQQAENYAKAVLSDFRRKIELAKNHEILRAQGRA